MTIESKPKKKFDCVEMMHRGAARLNRILAGMTPEQELEFWEKSFSRLCALKGAVGGSPAKSGRSRLKVG